MCASVRLWFSSGSRIPKTHRLVHPLAGGKLVRRCRADRCHLGVALKVLQILGCRAVLGEGTEVRSAAICAGPQASAAIRQW